MKKYYLLILAIIFNVTCANADHELRTKVSKASSEYLESRFMNGSYMFCDDEGVIEQGSKGIHSLTKKTKLKPNQQMPIASATKIMTAAAIMKLRESGKLDVQDSVAKHLDAKSGIWKDGKVPEWANKVKIHNLLTHRSGIPEYFMAAKLDVTKPNEQLAKDVANFAGGKELKFTPGDKHHYCNTNFVLLGLIIETVSGKKLDDFYRAELFEPLGMKDTRMITLDEAVKHQTTPDSTVFPVRYFIAPTGAKPHFNEAKSKFLMVPFADGGMLSTTSDMIKWHKGLHSGKVVSDESYKLMTSRHYDIGIKSGMKTFAGYGLYIAEMANGEVIYHHAGKAVAIRSESGYIPSKKLYFAVLSNVMNYIPKKMQDKVDMKKVENQLDIRHFTHHIFNSI